MAKKKKGREVPKRILKRQAEPIPMEETIRRLPDRRVIEGAMRSVVGGLGGSRGETPLHMAQDVMYKAFQSNDPKERAELARQALELSPDCADAYVLLAEQSRSRKEALELLENAVEAGERALGKKAFKDDVGFFWGRIETRPYMRAREGLASLLWAMARRDEAIGHLQEMLRLNPNDNQGVRYTLAGWLLAEGLDVDLARLLKQYDEHSASWVYTKALLAFRQSGDTSAARELLGLAKKANAHIPAYLLGQKSLPREHRSYYSHGDQTEAIMYAANALGGWKETPGALTWLRATEQGTMKVKAPTSDSQRPTPLGEAELQRLSQVFDVWQAEFRLMTHWIKVAGEPVRPWVVLITSRSEDLVLAHEIADEPPGSEALWAALVKAMAEPAGGEPHRPTELHVRPDARWDQLTPRLEEVGIMVVPAEELDHADAALEDLARHLAGGSPPGLLEMPGIIPEYVASFYRAAAGYYRRAPWRTLSDNIAIKVECDRFDSGPWYGVVIGQSGVTFGLALYDHRKMLEKLWAGEMSDEDYVREMVSLTVTFYDETEILASDLDAGRRLGWEVAGPQAHPSIFRKERGLSLRPPLAWELLLLEGCLRASPAYMSRHRADDRSTHKMKVPVASGELKLVLSWASE
jgi:ST7 protein